MRYIKFLIVLSTFFCFFNAFISLAALKEHGDFLYAIDNVSEDNDNPSIGACIYHYTATPSNAMLEFPDEIDGYPLVGLKSGTIEDGNFFKHSSVRNSVKEIVVPETVEMIAYSFKNCKSLESVYFGGNNLREIGPDSFANCKSLVNIELPEGLVDIGMRAFVNCDSLEEFIIPSTVKYFGTRHPGDTDFLVLSGKKLKRVVNLSDCSFPIVSIARKGYYWSEDEDGKVKAESIPPKTVLYLHKIEAQNQSDKSNLSNFSSDGDSSNDSIKIVENEVDILRGNVYLGTWEKHGDKWKLRKTDGSYANSQWAQIDGKWYLLGPDSYMRTDWQKVNGKWYYLNQDGDMSIGWRLINGTWYWLEPTGEMVTGWKWIGDQCYYFDSSGAMWYGTTTPDGYRLDASGAWIQ